MTQVREICRRRAEQTIRDGLIGLQGQVVALIAELHVEGLLSAEDILHAAAQPRGLEHPRVVAAIDALADRWAEEAIRHALDSMLDGPVPQPQPQPPKPSPARKAAA